MDSVAIPSDFDPWMQPVNLLTPDGIDFTIPLSYFDQVRLYHARLGIMYGSQIGATLILLLVLLLLTRAEKRKSSIYLVNVLCLVTNFIRCVLLSCYTTSTIANPYSQLIRDGTRVTKGDFAVAVAFNTFSLIVTSLVMISLSIQVWVVCITTAPIHRYIIMGATSVVALVATGYKAAFIILNIKQTLIYQPLEPYKHVLQGSYITQAIAIWFFSCVFTYKLGYAIIQRRKLKMPQFGPMQVIFIMGCQTMLVPGTSTLCSLLTHASLTPP
jgi:pheromone alpha factor receptor